MRAASVATGFAAGQVSLEAKLRDTEDAVVGGADEIDMVISREAFLARDDRDMSARDIERYLRELCGVTVGRDRISRVTDAVMDDAHGRAGSRRWTTSAADRACHTRS